MRAHAAALLLTLLVDPGRVCGAAAGGGGAGLVDVRAACRRRGGAASAGGAGRVPAACRDAALLREVSRGVSRGAAECAHQFRAARWNCTAQRRSMRYVLLADTRETAFVNAIAAASAAQAVARACAAGSLAACACAAPAGGAAGDAWQWGGCADDVRAGVRRSRDLLDAPYRRRTDLHALLKLHNYNAGRSVVRKHSRVQCKCHGVSGSCVLRTCWLRAPTMREIGTRLKNSYDRAVKVMASNDGDGFLTVTGSSARDGGGGGGGGGGGSRRSGKRRRLLLYSEESPSYCAVEVRRGSLGTRGRECSGEACGALCCGRGHVASLRTDAVNCRCRFHWCCNVTCDTCLVQRRLHACL